MQQSSDRALDVQEHVKQNWIKRNYNESIWGHSNSEELFLLNKNQSPCLNQRPSTSWWEHSFFFPLSQSFALWLSCLAACYKYWYQHSKLLKYKTKGKSCLESEKLEHTTPVYTLSEFMYYQSTIPYLYPHALLVLGLLFPDCHSFTSEKSAASSSSCSSILTWLLSLDKSGQSPIQIPTSLWTIFL